MSEAPRQPTVPTKSAAELFGIPTVTRNAKDRLVHKAIDLFYTHGIHAVGLDRVIAEVGVTKTTFYKYFESKDDLIVAAIEARDAWEREAWGRAVKLVAGREPRNQLLGMFDVLDLWFNDADFIGCMFLNVAAEFPNPHDPIHQAAAKHKQASRDATVELARAAGAADPEAFADVYTATLEGTLIMRQVYLRNDAAKVMRPVIERLVEEHMPAVGSDKPAAD